MSSREELVERIAHHGARLKDLDPEKDKRVKKRILQTLGKLKKELAALGEVDGVSSAVGEKRKAEELEMSAVAAVATTLPRKKMKAIVKQINKEIAACAITKQLKQAKTKVRQAINKGLLPDVHTYTNLMNVHVRCGDLAGAAALLETMKERGVEPTIVTITTLIKGYCELGRVVEASDLLSDTISSQTLQPNTRTINTFLRGCVRFGYVDIGLKVQDFFSANKGGESCWDNVTLDYLVQLLCQRLDVEQATSLISDRTSILQEGANTEQSSKHPLEYASMCLSMSRALYILHGGRSAITTQWVELTRACLKKSKSASLLDKMKRHSKQEERGDQDGDNNINESLELFLRHSRDEIDSELNVLCKPSTISLSPNERAAWLQSLFRMVFLFGIDGRGDLHGTRDEGSCQQHWCTSALQEKIGFSNTFRVNGLNDLQISSSIKSLDEHFIKCFVSSISSSTIDVGKTFCTCNLPIHLELGAGAGEWVIAQAMATRGITNWISLERRFDRVYQTFSQLVCALSTASDQSQQPEPSNLAVMSGEALHVLSTFPADSLQHIFVNHPEPPARLTGEGQSEGQHMLTSALFLEMTRALSEHGRITIVTDSLAYGTSLIKSVAKLNSANNHSQSFLLTVNMDDLDDSVSVQCKEAFTVHETRCSPDRLKSVARKAKCSSHNIVLMRGDPGRQGGHTVDASSYFNRMWSKGQKTRRWFVVLQKEVV